MRVLNGVVVASFVCAIAACAGVNIYPREGATIATPISADDFRRVDGAAKAVGLRRIVEPESETNMGGKPAIVLGSWEWPGHEFTQAFLSQIRETGEYHIIFYDNHTPGLELIGPPCTMYMQFVAELKTRFGSDQSRLNFHKETCNPNGVDSYGNPYRE